MRKAVVWLLILAALAGAGFGIHAWREHAAQQRFLTVPPENSGSQLVFRIEPGQLFSEIAHGLVDAGVVSDYRRFVRLAAATGQDAKVRAGEFALNTGWTPARVLEEITTTPGIMIRVQVREGLPWWKVAQVVAESGLCTEQDFADAVHAPELLARYHIPADTLEGYLFPETYLLTRPAQGAARVMAETMLEQFFANARRLFPDGLPDPEALHRYVILASIIERETGAAEERATIGGVFANRLARGMLLQTDPTIIYGLGPAFDGNLRRSHLEDRANPYNTYVHPGLPPGPICSPGLDALAAAVHPEEHRYLFFVAKGDGTHHFSRTLTEHNEAVRKYQLRRNRSTYRSTKEQ